MTKKSLNTFFFLGLLQLYIVVTSVSYSQSDSSSNEETTPRVMLSGKLDFNYSSTNISNEFMQKLLFGGRIESRLKDKALDKTRKMNRFGVEVNYEVACYDLQDTLFKKLPDWHYYIGFGSYNNISTKFSKDLFKTVFYGNKQFENETANLGKSRFTSYKFEKITLGLLNRSQTTSIGISLIIGDRFNEYDIKTADMFTHTDGVQIDMDYKGKIRFSNDQKTGNFMAFNGAGFGIDFSTLVWKKRLTFSMTNLGFVVWARNPSFSNTSKKYEFEGIEIDNVLQTSSEEIDKKIEELLPTLENKSFTTILPTIFRLDKNLKDEEGFQSIYGLRYKLASNYFPMAYGGVSYKANDNFKFNSSLAYGGYTGLRASLGAQFNFKKIKGGIELPNLIGLISKSGNGNGFGVYLISTF